jgi:hypothetical protein
MLKQKNFRERFLNWLSYNRVRVTTVVEPALPGIVSDSVSGQNLYKAELVPGCQNLINKLLFYQNPYQPALL